MESVVPQASCLHRNHDKGTRDACGTCSDLGLATERSMRAGDYFFFCGRAIDAPAASVRMAATVSRDAVVLT